MLLRLLARGKGTPGRLIAMNVKVRRLTTPKQKGLRSLHRNDGGREAPGLGLSFTTHNPLRLPALAPPERGFKPSSSPHHTAHSGMEALRKVDVASEAGFIPSNFSKRAVS